MALAKDSGKESRVASQDPEKKNEAIRKFRMDLLGLSGMMSNEALEAVIIRNVVAQIQADYAAQYLQHLGVASSEANMLALIGEHPLETCEISTSGWDNLTEIIDTVTVTPTAKKPQPKFLERMREMLFNRLQGGDQGDETVGEEFDDVM